MKLTAMFSQPERHDPFNIVRHWNSQRTQKGWWHSFELPDGTRIDGVCDLPGLKNRIGQFPIAADLRGKRVLDIGTWDGWFAFEMERRGAEVVAVDNWDNPLFREMHARLDSRVSYRQFDIYDLTPDRVGRFDIVLFMGVLYHLKHPLLALERVCALSTDMVAVDSFVLREEHLEGASKSRAVMEFYENDEFGGQTDNWIGPNLACLTALCRTAGFARVEFQNQVAHSACLACYRKWLPPAAAKSGPDLINALHNINDGINFDTSHDDYVSVWFQADVENLTRDDVRPEVSGFGVRPFHVAPAENHRWQANFKLPPGLAPGWHDVSVRIGDGLPGGSKPIAVDIPLTSGPIRLTGVSDGKTWRKDEIDLRLGDSLSVWIAGLPDNADRNNIHAYLDGRRLRAPYVETRSDGEPRQVNLEIPADTPRGIAQFGVELAGQRTEAVAIQIL